MDDEKRIVGNWATEGLTEEGKKPAEWPMKNHAHGWRLTNTVLDSLPPFYVVDCACGDHGTVTEEEALVMRAEQNKPNPSDIARREFEDAAKKVQAAKRWSK